jgi:hypothetical protein
MPPVISEEIRDSAIRIVIRLGLGTCQVRGPGGNILELESRVAWATTVSELQNEGYAMVSPDEYGAAYGLTPAEVRDRIDGTGSLFAVTYASPGGSAMAVPLDEQEEKELLGPVPL